MSEGREGLTRGEMLRLVPDFIFPPLAQRVPDYLVALAIARRERDEARAMVTELAEALERVCNDYDSVVNGQWSLAPGETMDDDARALIAKAKALQ